MDQQNTLTVVDRQGCQGTGFVPPTATNANDSQWILVQFALGRELWVTGQMLREREDGSYFLDLETNEQNTDDQQLPAPRPQDTEETVVIPVIAETLDVQKRVVVSGGVRVRKVVHEHQQTIDELLTQQRVDVERIAINRFVDGPLENRYEDDTLIVPVVEEQLVVEKRFLLKEEVHIHKRRHASQHQQQIILRQEQAIIETKEKLGKD